MCKNRKKTPQKKKKTVPIKKKPQKAMTVAGSDPDKRAYAHYRWAKRYAAESDERSSLAHLRRAIHYTARQRFGGAEIWGGP
jgi:hypothetical protein